MFVPETLVCWPDGGWYLEAMDSLGGLIASSSDLVRFLNAYCWFGNPRDDPGDSCGDFPFFGSLDGTRSMVHQRPDGIDIAVIFNRRSDPEHGDYAEIEGILNRVADGIDDWE